MEHGWIKINHPMTYQVGDLIHIPKGQHKTICVLKGKLESLSDHAYISAGMIVNHKENQDPLNFKALEETGLIMIDCEEIQSEQSLMKDIVHSAVAYISDLKEKLLIENPSIRP